MDSKVALAVPLLLLLATSLFLAFNIPLVKASTNLITILPDGSIDPPTAPIQRDGDLYTFTDNIFNSTIVVKRSNIIIDGNEYALKGQGIGNGFDLYASGVTVRNTRIESFQYGVYSLGVAGGTIQNCKITNNTVGISFYGAFGQRNRIVDNEIFGNGFAIFNPSLETSTEIVNNIIRNNYHAIYIHNWGSEWGGEIMNNLISTSGFIDLSPAIVRMRNNTLIDSGLNVAGYGVETYLLQDIDTSNTINGKPIYFLKNKQNMKAPMDAGYIAFVNSIGVMIEDLTFEGNGQGVVLAGTTYSTIRNVTIKRDSGGIVLAGSSHNRIYGNNIDGNSRGLILMDSTDNEIYDNNITNSGISVYAAGSSDLIYHNNFINNGPPWIFFSAISWDNGYPSGGNYWSSYAGADLYSGPYQNESGSDGIGDTPFIIEGPEVEGTNIDHYPLMETWQPPPRLFGDVNGDNTVDIQDIVAASAVYASEAGDLNWNPDVDLTEPYGRIDICDLVTIVGHYGETLP